MKRIIFTLLFGLAAALSVSGESLEYNSGVFREALDAQGYPAALFDDLNATGNLNCVDVYEANVTLNPSCLDKVSFLRLFVSVEHLDRLSKEKALIKAYFDKECGSECFDWVDMGDGTGRLQSNSPAKMAAYTAYVTEQAEAESKDAVQKQLDYHPYCDINDSLATVTRLRARRKSFCCSLVDCNLTDGEQWQLYKNENCLRLIATELFSGYTERSANIEKGVFSKDGIAYQKSELVREKVTLQRLSDADITIRLPKDERFFQDGYDYNNWFVKIYAGYEFLGTENLLKEGTGRFGLSVYRQIELDPSETSSGFWGGFSLLRLHLFFDLAVSGVVVEKLKQEDAKDVNITEVARTGLGRIGAYWPFFRDDAAIDGTRFFYDFGLVGSYGLMSIEGDEKNYFITDAEGARLASMWTWGLRISSSPEMYAEYKWGKIGDYRVDVLRGQFPAYTFTKNTSLVLGGELYDFNPYANEHGVDDQVKFYVLWRYDLGWMENTLHLKENSDATE